MEIKKVSISKVKNWDKNPRNIKTEDYERLKRQIKKLGVYKPLVCFLENGSYITLGGNMRLAALKDLGQKEVEVSIVKPKTEAEKVEFSLSDNDRAGEYDDLMLAELVYSVKDEIALEDFKIDLGRALDLNALISEVGPGEMDFADMEAEFGEMSELEPVAIEMKVAKKYEEEVRKWLRNGERDTPEGMGMGVIKRCGLL
jgi:hypothetical protein